MHPSWKEASEIAQILESQRQLRTKSTTIRPSRSPDGTLQFRNELLGSIDNAIADLHRSQECLRHIPEFHDTLTELIGFVKQVRSEVPLQSPTAAFTRLQSLRAWIFWLPTKLLRGGEGDLGALAILAHIYSTALVLEPFFPGLEGSYLGCMTLSLIPHIDAILHSRQSRFPSSHMAQLAIALMDAPRHNVNVYKTPSQWPHQMQRNMNHTVPTHSNTYHAIDDFSSPSYVTSGSYTPTSLSPFPLAVTSPPFQSSSSYRSSGNFSAFYMSPSVQSSECYDDSLSDYSRPGTLEHSPAFSSYGNEYVHNMPRTEAISSFQSDLAHDVSVAGSNSVAPELWT